MVALGAAFILLQAATAPARSEAPAPPQSVELAQGRGTEPRELEPRYRPAPPEEKSWYNASYIFGMTRSVARSTMVPAAKVPLFVLTIPLDVVFLPFAAIGGMFG